MDPRLQSVGRKFPETRSLATLVGSVWESCNLARRAGHERAKPVGNVLFLHFRPENGFLAVGDPEKSSGRATTNHDKPRQPHELPHDNPRQTTTTPRQPHDNPRQTTTTPRQPTTNHDNPTTSPRHSTAGGHKIPQRSPNHSKKAKKSTESVRGPLPDRNRKNVAPAVRNLHKLSSGQNSEMS